MADTIKGSRPVTLVPSISTQGLDRFAHFAIYHLQDGHLDVLGAGGMGTTYRAFDLQLERPVALKVIHPQHFYHPDVRSRFLREARAAARLQHPNIAGVLYQGEENGICFYAMELVTGEDLQDYVSRVGPMDAVAALQICHQVLLGLDAAYQVHLLHRDLKPANIMLTRYHDHRIPHVKVIDFGLAKFTQEISATLVTRAGFMGTPGYASPEQCQELALDCRSDLYSLGSTLWFLLTGRELFEGSTLTVIQAHVRDEPDYASLPLQSEPIFYVLQRLLAKRPEDRPDTPMHAIQDIEYAIEALGGPAASVHHPIEPKLPPPGDPPTLVESKNSAKPGKSKSRLIWLAGGAGLVVLVAGLLTFWLTRSRKTEEPQFTLAPAVQPAAPAPAQGTTEAVPKVAEVAPAPQPVEPEVKVPEVPPAPPSPAPETAPSAPVTNSVFNLATEPVAAAPAIVSEAVLPVVPSIIVNHAPAPVVPVVRPDATGEKINSLGMKFVPLPFFGGDNWICAWETRLKDYRTFATETKRVPKELPSWKDPGFPQTDNDPVVWVSMEDATAFCAWLTQKEQAAGLIQPNQLYRVPTRLELEAGGGHIPYEIFTQLTQKFPNKKFPALTAPAKFPWGAKWPPETGAGNIADKKTYETGMSKRAVTKYDDGFPATAPVGSYPANAFGIYDLTGNAWELSASPDGRIARSGGSWASFLETDFSAREPIVIEATERSNCLGFRCVLVDQSLALSITPPAPR